MSYLGINSSFFVWCFPTSGTWIHGSSSSNDDEWDWPTIVDKHTTSGFSPADFGYQQPGVPLPSRIPKHHANNVFNENVQ
jgi:hypothetical protein